MTKYALGFAALLTLAGCPDKDPADSAKKAGADGMKAGADLMKDGAMKADAIKADAVKEVNSIPRPVETPPDGDAAGAMAPKKHGW